MLVDSIVGIWVTVIGIQVFVSPVSANTTASVWYAIGAIFVILGLLSVAVGYGLWKARPWAWLLGLWAGVVYVLLGLLEWSTLLMLLILMGIGSLLFYYLNRTDLKRYLGKVQS